MCTIADLDAGALIGDDFAGWGRAGPVAGDRVVVGIGAIDIDGLLLAVSDRVAGGDVVVTANRQGGIVFDIGETAVHAEVIVADMIVMGTVYIAAVAAEHEHTG